MMAAEGSEKFTFVSTGYNIRPMEVQAAVGKPELESLEAYVEKRRRIAGLLNNRLEGLNLSVVDGGTLGSSRARAHSWMHVAIRVNTPDSAADRLAIVRFLEGKGIETRPPLTGNFLRQPAVARSQILIGDPDDFPNADSMTDSCFLVGCHHSFSEMQIEFLVESIGLAAERLGVK